MKNLALIAAAFAVVAAPAFAEHHAAKAEKKTEVTKEEVTTTEVSGTAVAPAKTEKKTEVKTETKKEEHKGH